MTLCTTSEQASFGPYKILGPLGRGGMGEVYRAWDPRLEREVALKVLHERSETDPERVRRFIAEARAASALNHPNILAVFDAAVDGARPYIVSELIEGESLRQLVRRGPIPLKRMLDLAAQIADGLADAHAAGIAHRDLKPENIMVSRFGRAKILDFGLARDVSRREPGAAPGPMDGQTVTDPGLLPGTVPYMSPEQARGCAADFRSDQFSFGLILYEMVTGCNAFRRETPTETLDAIVGEEPTPVSALTPAAPLFLMWIIDRCLAKNPEERYGVTKDLHRDLQILRDRLPEAIARDTRGATAGQARRSLWRRVPLVVLALATLASATLAWRLMREPPPPDVTGLRFAPFATDPVYKAYPAWSPDGQTIAYVAEVDGVLQVVTQRRNSSTAVPITNRPFDCKFPFWSPDGRRIYFVSLARDRESLWWVPAAGGVEQMAVFDATRGAVSPDGNTVAFLRDEDARPDIVGTAAVWLANVDGAGEPTRYDRVPFGDLRFAEAALAFSPDGAWLGLSGVPTTIGLSPERRGWQFWLLPLDEGTPMRRLQAWSDVAPRVSSFTWLPDSRHIITSIISLDSSDADLWMADVQGDRAWPLTRGAVKSLYPSASPRGDALAFMSDEPHYDIVEVPLDGRPIGTIIGTSRNETDPVWSPRARAFAYVTDRSGEDEIWVRTGNGPLDERPLVTPASFTERTIMLASPSFSPDGTRIAYQRNSSEPVWPLRIWYSVVAGGTPVPLLPEAEDTYHGPPTWSPDGHWLAFAEWDGQHWRLIKVPLAGAQVPVTLRTDGVANATPQWSPLGDWITWETSEGFQVVSSADGQTKKALGGGGWLAHVWSSDGKRIYGVRTSEDNHLEIVVAEIADGRERIVRDLGTSPPVNNPVKGLSLGPDGRTLITSLVQRRGDLWLLEGIRRPPGILERLQPPFFP